MQVRKQDHTVTLATKSSAVVRGEHFKQEDYLKKSSTDSLHISLLERQEAKIVNTSAYMSCRHF